VKPILQALLIADHVYRDEGSKKFIVAGIFNQVNFHQPADQQQAPAPTEDGRIPLKHVQKVGSPFAYINLIDVRQRTELTLRYVDLDEHTPLMEVQITVNADDPLLPVQISLPLPPLPVPHAGVYSLDLLIGDELLGSCRITAVRLGD
jgi:hypothetical protein